LKNVERHGTWGVYYQCLRKKLEREVGWDLPCFYLVLWFMALYTITMIKTFRDKDSERLFNREPVKRFCEIERAARRKLEMLEAAEVMDNLRYPPGNRLEALKGDRKGQYSIRINDQYRVCFVWGDDNNAYDVEVCDYH
jgi:toxin HigB-1